ncbi:MAG: TatD family hydrolase [Gammaproteobacteria bacterium]|nr:TatD family hydrolase [Gammaproteobacteria bacterium]
MEKGLLVDIGVNLTSNRFDKDIDEVIKSAVEAGVGKMVVTGTNIHESEKAVALIQKYPGVLYSTAGIHPHDAKTFSKGSISELSRLLENDNVVAVGECGLDFNRNFSTPSDQLICFEAQLELAVEKQMPVFLHQRDAHKDFIKILSSYIDQLPAAVAHCFTGSGNELKAYLEMGLYIGITGWVCDERRGQELRSILNTIPLDRLMFETDAPYLLPRDVKPKPKSNRNEPKYLSHICQVVADSYAVDFAVIAEKSYQNSDRFFNLGS